MSRIIFPLLIALTKIFLDRLPKLLYNTHMKKDKKQGWTDRENKVLALMYYHAAIEELMDMLPGRVEHDIHKQVSHLRKRGQKFK